MSDRSNETIVGELIGEASTLWKTECGNEVFNSERAVEIVTDILKMLSVRNNEIQKLKAQLERDQGRLARMVTIEEKLTNANKALEEAKEENKIMKSALMVYSDELDGVAKRALEQLNKQP